MSEQSCVWAGSTRPRTLPNRHAEDCASESCGGCQPCTEPHCRICGRTHADGACAECLASTRADLHEIARLCGELPAEVEHRGINGEAMMLLAPAADPEAIGHVQASISAGRLPEDYLDQADHEKHPLFVAGSWDMVWRDALEHEEPTARLTLAAAVDYLDRQMTYMAGYEHVPFEDFARDLRDCRSHLAAVLHDQATGDRANVGCFECGSDLERRLGKEGFEDVWTCRRCQRKYTPAEYNFALRAKLEEVTREQEVPA